MLELLAEPRGGTAIEVFVQQHRGPERYSQRTFWDHARCGRRGHNAWNLGALAGLLIPAPLNTSQMGLDLHFKDGGFFGTRKRCKCLTTGRTACLRGAQVMHFGHHRESRALTAALALAARLLPPTSGTGRLGLTSTVRTHRFFAFSAVEALVQVADRGLQCFHLRLQGRFPLDKPLLLPPPVVRLPLALDIGLLCQDDCLLGKGCGPPLVPWGKFGGRPHLG